jgi:lipoprotein NlpI
MFSAGLPRRFGYVYPPYLINLRFFRELKSMSKNKYAKTRKANPSQPALIKKARRSTPLASLLPWLLVSVGITMICLFPMLQNEFTNWDDQYYIVNNRLLKGPDWHGIFTEAVVSNYHPLTMLSLTLNYQISQLDPFSYLFFNYLLHLFNTALVFYFIFKISNRNVEVAFLSSLIFGIHPMHVESVAWVAERKDVLYTFFFLLSLLQYWRFIDSGKKSGLWLSLLFFILSLLSKPAATILPLVLILLDYWKGKKINLRSLIEKAPFFIAAVALGAYTYSIQSRGAIAGFDLYPLWVRPFFGCYTLMIYAIRFFIPYPLSAFHPYPSPGNLGALVLLSPVFVAALAFLLWRYRKNKVFVFGTLFFIINLLLILQILSIGFTIVSERYTYVPYIGSGFMVSMWLYNLKSKFKNAIIISAAIISAVFGFITFQRTKVWHDGGTLWDDVISKFPDAPMPRTGRAGYLSQLAMKPDQKSSTRDSLNNLALIDCDHAVKIAPNEPIAFEKRGLIYLVMNKFNEAKADATTLIKLQPVNAMGYYIMGTIYTKSNEPQKALDYFNQSLALKAYNDFVRDSRGSLLVNSFQRYNEALTDFNMAISINPLNGRFYMNRSICYYKMGNIAMAKADAQRAIQNKEPISDYYKGLLESHK